MDTVRGVFFHVWMEIGDGDYGGEPRGSIELFAAFASPLIMIYGVYSIARD